MRRRVLGVVAAVALAAVGTFLVLTYVNSADERALEGEQAVEVLVVDETIDAGESAETLTTKVRPELVPAKVQAVGAVASLEELSGQVATVDLVPGEQLVAQRFSAPEVLAQASEFDVPEGLLEVTVSLSPDRAVGGDLVPGDLVAFVASFDPFDTNAVEPGDPESLAQLLELIALAPPQDEGDDEAPSLGTVKTPNASHIILHKLLITSVQLEQLPAESEQETATEEGVNLAPTGNLLVTLATSAPNVEKIVFTAEHGSVWLAAEPESASESGTSVQTRSSIYR